LWRLDFSMTWFPPADIPRHIRGLPASSFAPKLSIKRVKTSGCTMQKLPARQVDFASHLDVVCAFAGDLSGMLIPVIAGLDPAIHPASKVPLEV
jgi:hypothetical protein